MPEPVFLETWVERHFAQLEIDSVVNVEEEVPKYFLGG
jgi:hypothetical protein